MTPPLVNQSNLTECCIGQKAGDLVAALVPAFIDKCSRMEIRHSRKTRLFNVWLGHWMLRLYVRDVGLAKLGLLPG